MAEHYIASFEAGEVTKALYGRIDRESYPSSALDLKNFIVRPSGGARRRTGTTYFAESVANSRLIGWRAFTKAIIVEVQPGLIRLWDAEAGTKIAIQNYDYSENPDTQEDISTVGTLDVQQGDEDGGPVAADLTETAVSFSDVWKIQYQSLTKNNISVLVLVQEYENPLYIFAYNDGTTIHYGANYAALPSVVFDSGLATEVSLHDGSQPRCIGAYNRRLIYANFEKEPNKFLTTTDDTIYVNTTAFSKADGDGTRDQYAVWPGMDVTDTADSGPLASDCISDTTVANEIRWIQGREDLYFGTDEAIIRQHGRDETFDFNTVAKPIRSSEYAASFIQAFIVNESIMFLNADNTTVRAIQFSDQQQQYFAPSISRPASHLLEPGIQQAVYASSPNPIAYLLNADGDIAVLNYDVAASFANWSHLDTSGTFISIASVESDAGSLVFVLTKRTTSSSGSESDIYLIEQMEPYTTTKADMHYVDAGKIVTGSPVSEVTGLTWLQGQEVSILADGSVLAPQTVPDSGADAGKITIPEGFTPSTVHVGLAYESRVIPMPIPIAFGNKKNVEQLYLVLHETIGGAYGIYFDDGTTEEYNVLMAADLDASPDLFSGVIRVNYPGTWEPFRSIYIGQQQPLPMELLSIRATFVAGVR